MQDLPQNTDQNQEVTIREHIDSYLRKWPWIVGSIVISMLIAQIYLRYTPSTYNATATILIKNQGSTSASELGAFKDLGLVDMMNIVDFENEKIVLNSKTLSEKVVDELNLTVSYFKEGSILDSEIFSNKPFKVKVVSSPEETRSAPGPLYIEPISITQFKLKGKIKEESDTYNFGDLIDLGWGTILVTPNVKTLKKSGFNGEFEAIRVSISNRNSVAASIRSAIEIKSMTERSSVVRLSMVSTIPEKSRAILDELVKQYNADAMNDRNLVARNTAKFIQGRLEIITDELDSVETGKVEYKEEKKLTNIEAESQMFLQNANYVNKQQIEIETQIALINTMMDYLKNSSDTDLLPTNLGVGRESFASEIERYNQLILERNRLLQSSTVKNPMVIGLDKQIGEVRNNVKESMINARRSFQVNLNEVNSELLNIDSQIYQIPLKEKNFRSIIRQQEIKESLYLYLLQKREENAITLAVTTPRAKIVDSAYSRSIPIYPKKPVILIGSFFIGLVIPFLIIYLGQLLDNKIRSRSYIERHGGDIAIVGELPELGKREDEMIKANDVSVLAESFRILTTNLKYLFLNKIEKEGKGKIIFVTSTIKGEGKTFVSANLAVTLANGGARVVVVGADIRNPQLQRYIDGDFTNSGVVEYLVYPESKTDDYLQPAKNQKNLWLLVSGTIPPNPAELWMQDRAGEMFAELADSFDYVVVDTAPAMLVTDTLLLDKYGDVTIYTVRAGYTEKALLNFPVESKLSGKFKNMAFVLNDVSMANFGYGNKYGYVYGQKMKRTFWERTFMK